MPDQGYSAGYSSQVTSQNALQPLAPGNPVTDPSAADNAFLDAQRKGWAATFAQRNGRPPTQAELDRQFGAAGAPNAHAQDLAGRNPYRGAPMPGQPTAQYPTPGSVGVNDPRSLIAGSFTPGQNTQSLAGGRATMAGNAANNAVFAFNPQTGQMELRPNSYALDPNSGRYDPNQWQDNKNLMLTGAEEIRQGQGIQRNLFNQDGYNSAMSQGQAATAGVRGEAMRMGGADLASSASQVNQLGQYGQDINLLRRSAVGQGPSAAQAMAKSQLDSNIRAQASMAAGARGGNLAAAQRQASLAGSSMMMQSANQMSALRAQEQLTAQAQLAAAQGQHAQAQGMARGQDLQRAMQNVQGAGIAAQAAQQQTAAQAGLTGAQQAQYGLGLQQQQLGLGAYQQGLGNQLGLMGLQANVAGGASAGAQAGASNAIDLYKIAQGVYQGEVDRNQSQMRYEQQMAQQRQAAQDAQTAAIMGMGFGLAGPLLQGAFGPAGGAAAGVAQGAARVPANYYGGPTPTTPGPNGLIDPWGRR